MCMMMKHWRRVLYRHPVVLGTLALIVAFVATFQLTVATPASASGAVSVSGTIVDDLGNPVSGIQVDVGDSATTTDALGAFGASGAND